VVDVHLVVVCLDVHEALPRAASPSAPPNWCYAPRGKRMRKVLTAILLVVFVLSLWMSVDNVWSDVAPVQALAEQAACKVKDCKKHHGVTRISRMPIQQSFELTWEDGKVDVTCHRDAYVFGAMRCEAP
jgi:hypothetical protein